MGYINNCAAIILAGGLNSRFNGTNKAFLKLGHQRIFDHVYTVCKTFFKETVIVTNEPAVFLDVDAVIATDILHQRSSLTGIHAGLYSINSQYAFITASDTPFLKKELLALILDHIDARFDVIVPEIHLGLEPLCAVYSRSCLHYVEKTLQKKCFKIQKLYRKLRILKITEKSLREQDPELISFININSPEEFASALQKIN